MVDEAEPQNPEGQDEYAHFRFRSTPGDIRILQIAFNRCSITVTWPWGQEHDEDLVRLLGKLTSIVEVANEELVVARETKNLDSELDSLLNIEEGDE